MSLGKSHKSVQPVPSRYLPYIVYHFSFTSENRWLKLLTIDLKFQHFRTLFLGQKILGQQNYPKLFPARNSHSQQMTDGIYHLRTVVNLLSIFFWQIVISHDKIWVNLSSQSVL